MEDFKIERLSFCIENKKILNNINLSIKNGEFILLCGESGSGKTTLLRHFKSALIPNGKRSGKVFFRGIPIENIDDRTQVSEIGYVFQSPENQIVSDDVFHELSFALENLGMANDKIKVRVAEVSNFFGIQKWVNKNTYTLSGGEKQILNLASVMILNPSVLILDEPTSQLDPIFTISFFDILKRINREFGTTIILSEHKINDIFYFANKVIILDKGSILTQGSPSEIVEDIKNLKKDITNFVPDSAKVYLRVNSDFKPPLTIKDGIEWLNKLFQDKSIVCDKILENNFIRDNFDNAIELKNVYFRYDIKKRDIIIDASFSIKFGEIYCILGGNGEGKTTLIDIISGINKPYKGKVKLFSQNLKNYYKSKKRDILFLPQNIDTMFSRETVRKEIENTINNIFKDEREKNEYLDEASKKFKLNHLLSLNPYDISIGEKQRLALLKIFILRPKVVVLDEPTKGMDENFKIDFAKLLKDFVKRGGAVLMVSHDLEFCAQYADVCALFFDGSIILENDTRTFFSNNNFYTTYSNKMSRHKFKNAITNSDVVELCNRNIKK